MKQSKSKLKENYYYEYTPLYDALPDKLEVPAYSTEIFTKSISHKDILEKYNIVPYTIEQALAVAIDCIPTLKNDYKGRLVYFKNGDTLCRLNVFRFDDGELSVSVDEVNLGPEWDAGYGVMYSNTLIPSEKTLSTLDSMTLENAIKICKENGLEVARIITTREVL